MSDASSSGRASKRRRIDSGGTTADVDATDEGQPMLDRRRPAVPETITLSGYGANCSNGD
jgi:hypothetical protein